MMIKRNLSEEITSVFSYIKDIICAENPNIVIDEYSYILAVLNCEDSLAYQALSSVVLRETLENMRDYFRYQVTAHRTNEVDVNPYTIFDDYIIDCNDLCKQYNVANITSSILLLSIIRKHEAISKKFKDFSLTTIQLFNSISSQLMTLNNTPKKHIKKKKNMSVELPTPIKIIDSVSQYENTEIDRHLINITKLAKLGKIPQVINYDKYYSELFTILSKKERNNVIICGKSGVGKTATVKNLANLINNKKCHKNLYDKILVEMDFSKLVIGTPFKGAFEQKFYSIIEEAKLSGNYIFFIDNIHLLVNGNTKYAETDIESLLELLLSEPLIQVVCTITPKAFSLMQKKSILGKYFQSITLKEPTNEEAVQILNEVKPQYEAYHDVLYSEDAIKTCVELCTKYAKNRALPDCAIDLLDIVGAESSINSEGNPKLLALEEELSKVTNEIDIMKSSTEAKEYDKIDDLVKQQINLKSQISITEKEDTLSKAPILITKKNMYAFISKKIGIPLEELSQTEKTRLKGLSTKIKENVIGQDEAIDEVCRAVKRQRVGLGENEKPSVLMFLGSTGTGKTYLAKQLAKEVFGDEKCFVRMDMSEYADKTSINKISGSNPGYVGYEDETFLVKALKKQRRFVLLLDEFEKSNEEVHNIFLQIFDEGRFTDNHGEEYSLKDVIIIMTSNVGVTEATNRGRNIGFSPNNYDLSQEIIEKELKRKFKPEFLNRINKIVYFNKLKDSDIRSIIKLEINKLNKKVNKLGYKLSEDITNTLMVDNIYNEVIKKKEFGARPIVMEVQRQIEDNIVDFIINNEVEEGHMFTYEEITNLDS